MLGPSNDIAMWCQKELGRLSAAIAITDNDEDVKDYLRLTAALFTVNRTLESVKDLVDKRVSSD
jgi:hypothetical protein